MRVILITPETKSIDAIEISSLNEIAPLIGFDTIEFENIGAGDSQLYFDEECFIRGDAAKGRFQLDTMIPIAGKAVIVGSIDLDDLKTRIKFM